MPAAMSLHTPGVDAPASAQDCRREHQPGPEHHAERERHRQRHSPPSCRNLAREQRAVAWRARIRAAAFRGHDRRLRAAIAAPIIGGMVTSTIHVLIITPVIFYIVKRRALRKGTLRVSGMTP